MQQKDWIDRLDDEEIYRLTSKKPKYKKISYFVDNKLLNVISDKEKLSKERKKFYILKFTKIALSSSFILICLLFLNIFIFRNYFIFNKNIFFVY
jgi:hypothetical protein